MLTVENLRWSSAGPATAQPPPTTEAASLWEQERMLFTFKTLGKKKAGKRNWVAWIPNHRIAEARAYSVPGSVPSKRCPTQVHRWSESTQTESKSSWRKYLVTVKMSWHLLTDVASCLDGYFGFSSFSFLSKWTLRKDLIKASCLIQPGAISSCPWRSYSSNAELTPRS